MKRYRILRMEFDFTANCLDLPLDDSFDDEVREQL